MLLIDSDRIVQFLSLTICNSFFFHFVQWHTHSHQHLMHSRCKSCAYIYELSIYSTVISGQIWKTLILRLLLTIYELFSSMNKIHRSNRFKYYCFLSNSNCIIVSTRYSNSQLIHQRFDGKYDNLLINFINLFRLKYKIANVNCIVKIISAHIVNTAGMEIKCTDIGMINAHMWCFDIIGAVSYR